MMIVLVSKNKNHKIQATVYLSIVVVVLHFSLNSSLVWALLHDVSK